MEIFFLLKWNNIWLLSKDNLKLWSLYPIFFKYHVYLSERTSSKIYNIKMNAISLLTTIVYEYFIEGC